GLDLRVFEGFRSRVRQNKLYNNGKNVTKVKGGGSYHNYGLAVDIVFYNKNGEPSWSENHDWGQLGAIGKQVGLKWGGDFKSISDRSHLEYHPGINMREIQNVYRLKGLKGVWDLVSEKGEE
ncbi:hypothetical protein BVY03_01090, partial [bacterium K02(2017)]